MGVGREELLGQVETGGREGVGEETVAGVEK